MTVEKESIKSQANFSNDADIIRAGPEDVHLTQCIQKHASPLTSPGLLAWLFVFWNEENGDFSNGFPNGR